MPNTKVDQAKTRVRKLIEKWKAVLGLNDWTIEVKYHHQSHPNDHHDGLITTFECTDDWRYMYATLDAYIPAILSTDRDYLEHIVIHELLHIVLGELRESMKYGDKVYGEHEEHVATQLAVAFERSNEGARKK